MGYYEPAPNRIPPKMGSASKTLEAPVYLMFQLSRVLIANRGEIACRIIRCCQENGLHSIAVYSSEDSDSAHVLQASESHLLKGIGSAAYIDIDQVVTVAIESRADVVVPGYGFLSENSEFAAKLAEHNIVFAGPSSESVKIFGLKHSARELAVKNDVPVVPGTGLVTSEDDAAAEAQEIGYPVMIKSTAGGGGMGLKVCYDETELRTSFVEVVSRGATLFKNLGAFLEKYVEQGRHIEIQVFGNGQGNVVAFGERECSIQRRHQKVIEEAPSPLVTDELRAKLVQCATALAASVNYKSAGTVEFLVDDETSAFYFLEMNTRLQVEHGITELVYSVDLVKMMLLQADYETRGEKGIPASVLYLFGSPLAGHAIECRVYAENPVRNFAPSPGVLHFVEFAEPESVKVRVDHWISTGTKVSPYFDPLLAKVMVWAPTRELAIKGMYNTLKKTRIQGPLINIDYLMGVIESENFKLGKTLTSFLSTSFNYSANLLEFIQPGAYTTIQDLPGHESSSAGVPLSGPVDPLSLQIANLIVGNDKSCEALEITVKGPSIRFHTSAVICLAGDYSFEVNKRKMPCFSAIEVPAGSTVKIGEPCGSGARAYLAVKGGFPGVATYLGSKSCVPTLNIGGHQGRVILPGDCLELERIVPFAKVRVQATLPEQSRPQYDAVGKDGVREIKTISGPHASLDITSQKKMEAFYNTIYTVNLNSNRGCTRLDGPSDVFSRKDGRDGGSHPSNILEYPYPTCGISVVGSVMCLFGVDGGTLSGFVCIAVPIRADWWKAGQARIGAKIRFVPVSYQDALRLSDEREAFLQQLQKAIAGDADFPKFKTDLESYDMKGLYDTILYDRPESDKLPQFTVRQAGELMILFDFGVQKFTLLNNGRQRAFELALQAYDKTSKFFKSIVRYESCSGAFGLIFDRSVISREKFVDIVVAIEADIPPPYDLRIKSRRFNIPACFEHLALTHCIERYMHSQRPHAPYLPSNLEYVRRANNLTLVKEFKASIIGQPQVVTAVSFFCANTLSVNLDPRTRFKTGKYNPARTFTPKGAIGSGSVGQSIYSIDSPGGYMIWGMTLPDLCWNTFGRLNGGKPWFFENFDQIVYYEVDEATLSDLNNQLLLGKLDLKVEEIEFDFGDYDRFLKEIDDELQTLNAQKTASTAKLVEEEEQSMAAWLAEVDAAKEAARSTKQTDVLSDSSTVKVTAGMAANVFKINTAKGATVTSDEVLVILEAMKMEIAVRAVGEESDSDDEEEKSTVSSSTSYEVLEVIVEEGDVVAPGDTLLLLKVV